MDYLFPNLPIMSIFSLSYYKRQLIYIAINW